jgi:hypothetical protein
MNIFFDLGWKTKAMHISKLMFDSKECGTNHIIETYDWEIGKKIKEISMDG